MKITEYEDWMNGEMSYNIKILPKENVNYLDLAESFKAQYPNGRCVISFSKVITKVELGFLIVGLKLNKVRKKK